MNKSIVMSYLLVCSTIVFSEEATLNQINKKIEQLENRVSKLEVIIANQKNDKTGKNISTDRKKWRNLSKGMSQSDVRNLLGEPLTIRSSVFTHWYYSESVSHSYVSFDPQNIVNGWNEPE